MAGVTIEGDFEGTLYDMERELPDITRKALYSAALLLRDEAKDQLVSDVPKARQRNKKYNDTLEDAVRVTKIDGSDVYVHILGVRSKGSGTFRTRFFEKGTKDRYQKTYRGVKLKKKKFIGNITGNSFFKKAVSGNLDRALRRLEEVFSKRLENIFTKSN